MPITSTKIAGVNLNSYVFNASGPMDVTHNELIVIAKSESSAITMKSCTIEPRKGNEEPRYTDIKYGSINSMGLPNLGYKEYIKISSKLKKYSKPIIASIAGLCEEDYTTMVLAFQKSEVDLIEVNLSCPNIKGKPQVAYDFEQSERIIRNISNLGKKPIGLKLPPYYDFAHHQQMAEIIKSYSIKFITLINSIGNAIYIDAETESVVIKPKLGFGGLGGHYIKPVALSNVRKFYELLGKKVDIIGCGGIYTGRDAFEYLLAGASSVQLGTVYMQEGQTCFGRINKELSDILERKGYKSIGEVKGKLRYIE
ncbi:MAG: dihydroorotate oxidase [Nanoarchaeota archaeon]